VYNNLVNLIIEGVRNQFTYELGGNLYKFNDFSDEVTKWIEQGYSPSAAKEMAIGPSRNTTEE
jgi:hypothetical protein